MSEQMTDETQLDAALAAERYLVFKHSLICPVSTAAFEEYRQFAAAQPDVPTAWIDVIGSRPWSLRVEAATGVRHESPQALILRAGKVVWHVSHRAITADALRTAWAAYATA